MKYRKKPVVIEAFRLDGNWFTREFPSWWMDAHEAHAVVMVMPTDGTPGYAKVKTLEGEMRADYGDWIIRGIKGELHPCKHDIFEATYERVE